MSIQFNQINLLSFLDWLSKNFLPNNNTPSAIRKNQSTTSHARNNQHTSKSPIQTIKSFNMCITLTLRLMRMQRKSNEQARAGYPGYTPDVQEYAPQPHPVNGMPQYAPPTSQPVNAPYQPEKIQQ